MFYDNRNEIRALRNISPTYLLLNRMENIWEESHRLPWVSLEGGRERVPPQFPEPRLQWVVMLLRALKAVLQPSLNICIAKFHMIFPISVGGYGLWISSFSRLKNRSPEVNNPSKIIGGKINFVREQTEDANTLLLAGDYGLVKKRDQMIFNINRKTQCASFQKKASRRWGSRELKCLKHAGQTPFRAGWVLEVHWTVTGNHWRQSASHYIFDKKLSFRKTSGS